MKRCIAYLRVSTTGQADDGISLEMQESRIKTWCELSGITEALYFRDPGISGGSIIHRPGLKAALAEIRKGDVLVSYSISRLSRSTKDLITIAEMIQNRGADLVSLTEKVDTTSAAGKLLYRVLASVGEWERDQVSERTKQALRHKREIGERAGNVPYGFAACEDGKSLRPCDYEQAVIAHAKALRGKGHSLRKIAASLASQGFVNRKGNGFGPGVLARMLVLA